MKILVTGGAGYIGSHTCLALLKAGHDVVILDNFSNSSSISVERIQHLSGRSAVLVEGDICDRMELRNLFEKNKKIDGVIHFAAFKAVGQSTEHPLCYYQNNVGGSISLLQEMERAGIENLVFSSSCTVYGEPQKVPIDESHPVGSVSSPYGRTKSMMEEIIKDFCSANPKFNDEQ